MNGNNEHLNLSRLPVGRVDAVCSPEAFAEMCGVSDDTVMGWMRTGTVPTVKVRDARLINIERLCEDLEQGKDLFAEGDYDND
ncbi:helix-turn-helix domain-containing protein [Metapseudomonas boanensis]|uniref:DNA-binding protein n=1 Tax=Metapseudomonas boanensis TaxID=2822138 RepID=A0ABS5XIS1_9GAMM|nr:helix-turn-helix domain-containing protein [Pseudomonas boanensis]MBT8767569.1 DNA-binding protein [Pseudomonas boanensis]